MCVKVIASQRWEFFLRHDVVLDVLITSFAVRVQSIATSLSVLLYVCLSARISQKPRSKLHKSFCKR